MRSKRLMRVLAIGLTGGVLLQGSGCVGALVTVAASIAEASLLTALIGNG